jgi:AraC-like DNA-binding protein
VGVERHTVERTFRSVTGQSFRDLRQNLLVERAAMLLGRGRYIKENAFDLGLDHRKPSAALYEELPARLQLLSAVQHSV